MNSDKDIPLLSSIYKSKHTGRASASTRKKGSITVEAAMAVPIFFFATLALVLLLELLSVQTAVRSGLQEAGKKLAVQSVEVPAVIPSNLEHDVVNSIGAERLERSIVEGGSSGINCNQSYLSPFTGIGEIQASYQVRIPVVYVTDTGVVYHKNPHCTHLDLSIHAAASSELNSLRNESGGKYHACEKCVHGSSMGGSVYITDQGDRYHNSLTCSGLKRTVYTARISEVPGKRACSKCGGK